MVEVQHVSFLPCFRYMEEVIESTFSLLSFHHDRGSASVGTEKGLEPIHLLAILDIKASWFKKWMVCVALKCCWIESFSLLLMFCSDSRFVLSRLCPRLSASPSLSMDTTAGLWFSDSWRENTNLWWVIYSEINISQLLLCTSEWSNSMKEQPIKHEKSLQKVISGFSLVWVTFLHNLQGSVFCLSVCVRLFRLNHVSGTELARPLGTSWGFSFFLTTKHADSQQTLLLKIKAHCWHATEYSLISCRMSTDGLSK